MGMYFSGNPLLQNIVAPTLRNVPLFSAREFGALEMLQNFLLLCICFYSIRGFIVANRFPVKLVTFLLLLASVFTLLEEIDYGAHFIEYLTGEYGSLAQQDWNRNWHNKAGSDGVQNVSYIKLAANIGLLAGFVIGPLLLSNNRNPLLRLLVPSKWMISTVILIVALSLLAKWLDGAGYSIINGVHGNLDKNISEFRELNMYYLLLLYVALLYRRIRTGVSHG